jgi:maltoporin
MYFIKSFGLPSLLSTLAAGVTMLVPGALSAQNSDVDTLKAQIQQLQQKYDESQKKSRQEEQRIESMEAQITALKVNGNQNTILNTRILTDADGKQTATSGPLLDQSFLKSLTRNFTFSLYMRAGFQFNGSGGAGDFTFEIPDGIGRFRLGNENDYYAELNLSQAHILGDSPDVVDASVTTTLVYQNQVVKQVFMVTNAAVGQNVGFDQAYVEMKNVLKSAPEVTFWAGDRFYDRWNTDPNDWFWLNTSGFGTGAYNMHLGPGNLYVAWLGSYGDNLNLNGFGDQTNVLGNQFKHTFDVRYRDVDIGFGKLNFILIGNYIKGGTVTSNAGATFKDIGGNIDTVNVTTSDQYGIGGGLIWQYDFGNSSYLRLFGLFGTGATNFSSDISIPAAEAFENDVNRVVKGLPASNVRETAPGVFTGGVNPTQNAHLFRAGWEYVWNVNPCFALDFWGYWDQSNEGFQLLGSRSSAAGTATAVPLTLANATRNLYGIGVRPVFWILDNFAIQGQAGYNYVDNVRGYSGSNAFGRGGGIGVFSIAPTIKPRGGYFTRPEIRLFATYSIWSNSLRGSTTPMGEGANFGVTSDYSGSNPSVPPYNRSNQGWLLGTQAEIFF